uniref:ORF15 n=1 Tax=Human herpesvirus 3 TaxID=10335 RepID=A0A4D6F939_HHV3|nr:ORF15 [Human alphaherpesvirus 3]
MAVNGERAVHDENLGVLDRELIRAQSIQGCVGNPQECNSCAITSASRLFLVGLQASVITSGLILQYHVCEAAVNATIMGLIVVSGLWPTSVKFLRTLAKLGRCLQTVVVLGFAVLWAVGCPISRDLPFVELLGISISAITGTVAAVHIHYYNFVTTFNGPHIHFYVMMLGTGLGGLLTVILYMYVSKYEVLIGLCISIVTLVSIVDAATDLQDTCIYRKNRHKQLNTYTDLGFAVVYTQNDRGRVCDHRESSRTLKRVFKGIRIMSVIPPVLYIVTPLMWAISHIIKLNHFIKLTQVTLAVSIGGHIIAFGLQGFAVLYQEKKNLWVIVLYTTTSVTGIAVTFAGISWGAIIILTSTVAAGLTCIQMMRLSVKPIDCFMASHITKVYHVCVYIIINLCYLCGTYVS